jgi:hypothetical protein
VKKPMSHTVNWCKFSAFIGVSLDDNVDGSKMMRPEEVLFSEKVVLPLR